METDKRLVGYASETKFEDPPRKFVNMIKNVILTVLGATIAGATAEGCEPLVIQGVGRQKGGNDTHP
jgi:2-methylcitrate dehydratase PrpD